MPRPPGPAPIALVITELDVGGAERALVALARGLDRGRWTPHVIALGPEAPLAAPLRDAGISCTCLGVTTRRPATALRRLRSALAAHHPVLIQSFLFHANVAARLAASTLRPRPWIVGGIRVAERQKRWHLALERATARLGAGWVCVSEGVRRFSVETAGLAPDRLVVIPNGIDPAPFDAAQPIPRRDLGVSDSDVLTLFIGRLDPQKGLTTLLEAARAVALVRPSWQLRLVGDGPSRPTVLAAIDADPLLRRHVAWLGRRDDVPAILRTADLLVLPSLWEGMPNVVLEAMAAGLPVVATAVEGTTELVRPGGTGWLVPPGDAPALAAALIAALAAPDRSALGHNARRLVLEHHAQSTVVDRYGRLWSGLLGWKEPEVPASLSSVS